MKKLFLIPLLFLASITFAGNIHYITDSTTVASGKDYIILISTDKEMIEQIDKTTKIFLVFSRITTENGVTTGRFYYPKERNAYVITRAHSIESFWKQGIK